MKTVIRRMMTMAAALLATASISAKPDLVQAQTPAWLSTAVIYCVNPEIFSTNGLTGVTAQLPRLSSLGVNTIWLMPSYPRGNATTVGGNAKPSYDSPYDISNFEAVDPSMGTSSQLTTLVTTAHNLGMKVILDIALNCTSWDNPLITSTPQYYYHSDGNVNNSASIQPGWYMTSAPEADVAMLNLSTNTYGAQTYVTNVCQYWVNNYHVDGFRVDSADNPTGTSRTLPQSLMQSIQTTLGSSIMMLGEEENVSLALAPYGLDYGWNMWYYGVESAFGQGGGAYTLQYQWQYPYTSSSTSPAGMLHMNIQDDWDLASRDNITLGGYPQAMAAAVFNCTTSGVPLIYNGMEVANNTPGGNPHAQINWNNGSYSYQFSTFYQELLALRNNSAGALQQGTTTWVTNSSSAVSSYDRTGGGQEYLIEVNTSTGSVSGTISPPAGGAWVEVTPVGGPGGQSHTNPGTGNFSLAGDDFAIFQRSSGGQPAATPTFSLAPGTYTGTQTLTITDATSGASIYYTTNGSQPTTASPKYTGAISLTGNETVEAMAVGAAQGFTRTANYNIVSGTGGSLSGAVTPVTTAMNVNLTNQGTSDWAAWGYLGSDTFDQSTSGSIPISDAGLYNGGGAGQFSNSILTETWTNGNEDGSVSSAGTGIYNGGGVGDGFVFTVPASTSSATLTVYLGGWESGGTLTASLSDNSAPAYTNSSLVNTSTNYYGYYTITFKAASAGQTLKVTWVQSTGSGNVTLQAATLSGGSSTPTVATPTFSPSPGVYSATQSVTLSDTTAGSSIYYTTNGTTPTTSSTKYTAPISVSATETIQALGAETGYNNSPIASGNYQIIAPTAATPTFSPAGGAYGSAQTVAISDTTSGSSIYYTTNGTTPTTSSTKYTAPISVSASETVEAIAAASGYTNSSVGTAAYTIETTPAAPTGLTATPGNAKVTLSWTASSGANTYNVYRSTSAGGEGTAAFASAISATTYTDSAVTNGTKYYYKVAAVNLAGTSAQSSEASATPAAPVEGPYGGTAKSIPGTVYADTYDTGGQGLGYSVSSVNGTDNTWRSTGDGVDLEACTDTTTNGADVGWSASGQWFRYTVNVATAGTYAVSFRAANGSSTAATLHLQNSAGTNLSGTVTIPATGGWETFTTVTANVTLSAGTQVLTVNQDSANFNLNYLSFAAAGAEGPYGGTAQAIPGTIYADTYDTGGAGVGYYVTSVNGTDNGWRSTGDGVDLEACSDSPTNGANVGWSAAGQWFKYTVNVSTAGSYVVSFRAANGSSSAASFTLQNASGTTLATVSVPSTGGWQTFTTITANVTLSAGKQVLEINQGSANFNLNYMSFAAAGSGSLSGALTTVTSAQAFNLTSIGTTDWAAWGFNGTDRDSSGGSKIGQLFTYSGGSLNSFTSSFLGLTWTNGTPDTSETNETNGYYNNGGVGDGFSFQVPASTTTQHITVYVGGWETGGTLSAVLSDGSAASYSNSSMSNTTNSYYGYYTLTFAAGSAGQHLTVNWVQNSGSGNVTIYGAALH